MLQQSVLLLERVDKSDAPARVHRRPIELTFRFCSRAPADLRHHRNARLADGELAKPVRNSVGWFASYRLGKDWQPGRHLGRVVIDDVVNARYPVRDGCYCSARGVDNVDEGPNPVPAADNRQPALANHLEDRAAFSDRGSRTVKHSVAHRERLQKGDTANLVFQVADGSESFRKTLRRFRIERILLG